MSSPETGREPDESDSGGRVRLGRPRPVSARNLFEGQAGSLCRPFSCGGGGQHLSRHSSRGAVRPLGGGDAGSFPLRGEGLPGADRPRPAEGSARTPLEGSGRTLCRRASAVSGGGKAVDGVVPVSPVVRLHAGTRPPYPAVPGGLCRFAPGRRIPQSDVVRTPLSRRDTPLSSGGGADP